MALASALVLGFYDLAKKVALRDNPVPPVLFFSVLTGALVWLPGLILSVLYPSLLPHPGLRVDLLTLPDHLRVLAKAVLVSGSWIAGYYGIKHLPLSIAGPIRSTAPLWTILIAVLWMGERPSGVQWTGMSIILGAFYAFSFLGRREGIHFHRDRWVGCMMIATLLGALSSLYDKYLLQNLGMRVATLQCWFALDLLAVMGPFYLLWRNGYCGDRSFRWHPAIPWIGIGLLLADFLYFTAIHMEGSLISVISPLRRTSVIVTFLAGIHLYDEKQFRRKAVCLILLLVGVALLYLRP